VQECLTNVQRHSGSATVRVSVERSGDRLSFEIDDDGRGSRPLSAPTTTLSSLRASASPGSTSASANFADCWSFIRRSKERR
jgi:anti-sigma regulatory factor (Ser/Thr protein kinase)